MAQSGITTRECSPASSRSFRAPSSESAWQGARDAIKHGETTLKELEEKVGFAARYRRVQQKLEELEQLVIDARFECTGPSACLTTTEYADTLTKMLGIIRSIDEANED